MRLHPGGKNLMICCCSSSVRNAAWTPIQVLVSQLAKSRPNPKAGKNHSFYGWLDLIFFFFLSSGKKVFLSARPWENYYFLFWKQTKKGQLSVGWPVFRRNDVFRAILKRRSTHKKPPYQWLATLRDSKFVWVFDGILQNTIIIFCDTIAIHPQGIICQGRLVVIVLVALLVFLLILFPDSRAIKLS